MAGSAIQNFVIKVESNRLSKSKWNLTLPLAEAKKNGELVTLGESQLMRWLCELRGISNRGDEILSLKKQLKRIKREPNSIENRRKIRKIYDRLDELEFQPDYVLVVMNSVGHYRRLAKKGFKLNGKKYRRLLGTAGGVKTKTIIFLSENVYQEIWKRIECGRDETIPIVPGKLDSYRALACSVSLPVSYPNGIVIVRDAETTFTSDVINLRHDETDEPVMEFKKDEEVTLNISDGMGLMTPELAERWGKELGLDYAPGGLCIRAPFTKGMAFTFPILEFADEVAGTRIIEDIYGRKVDLSDIELVLTESQVKLWKSYNTTEDFLRNCQDNHYSFSVTKIAPPILENERTLNLL